MNLEGQGGEGSEPSSENPIHDETMRRVELLRRLTPDRNKFKSRGYGHRWASLDVPFDETEKSISTDYLLPSWATQTNGFYSKLGVYPHRPETWREYAEFDLELRKEIFSVLEMLQRALEAHFRKKGFVNLFNPYVKTEVWDSCLAKARNPSLFPKSAVDEWGFTGESSKKVVDSEGSTLLKLTVPFALNEQRNLLEH